MEVECGYTYYVGRYSTVNVILSGGKGSMDIWPLCFAWGEYMFALVTQLLCMQVYVNGSKLTLAGSVGSTSSISKLHRKR